MKYLKFEDLPVWQQSRELVNDIYKLIATNRKLRIDFSLTDQLKRAVYSIMLNIAEGFERGGNKEFANFINIAKGSAGEVRTILYILLDNEFINTESYNIFNKKVVEISCSLSNFRMYLLKNIEYKK